MARQTVFGLNASFRLGAVEIADGAEVRSRAYPLLKLVVLRTGNVSQTAKNGTLG